MSGALSRDASLQFERSMQSAPPHGLQEYSPILPIHFGRTKPKTSIIPEGDAPVPRCGILFERNEPNGRRCGPQQVSAR